MAALGREESTGRAKATDFRGTAWTGREDCDFFPTTGTIFCTRSQLSRIVVLRSKALLDGLHGLAKDAKIAAVIDLAVSNPPTAVFQKG